MMKPTLHPGKRLWYLAGICLVLCMAACIRASYYRINLAYTPQKTMPGADSSLQHHVITVTAFNDERSTADRASIGRQIKSDGSEIKAVSQPLQPGSAVAAVMKDFFFRNGYTVYGGAPDWDLNEKSIDSRWGLLAVGGVIEELDVVCTSAFANVQYEAKVRLRIVFADVQHKKILYRRTLESTSTYRHLLFQEERLQQELNAALSTAVEKIFEDDRVAALVEDITRVRSESIVR